MQDPTCPSCNGQAGPGQDQCSLLVSAYVLAGLAMMLNIRLSYSSAPYALIRFRLPENLFSVFVRRMASALELWCLPSMLLGNLMELVLKLYYQIQQYESDWTIGGGNLKPKNTTWTIKPSGITFRFENIISNIDDLNNARQYKFWVIIFPSIVTQWLNFLTYVILFFVYVIGDDQGHLTLFYLVIAISGFVFGINMVLVYAADWNYTPVYIAGENSFPIITSFMHYVSTLIFGNRRKWNSDFIIVMIDIWVAIVISFIAAVVWTLAYGIFRNTQKENLTTYHKGAISGNLGDLTANTISAITIDSITVTDNEVKTTTYNQVSGPAAQGAHALTITKVGEGQEKTATFKKEDGTTVGDPVTLTNSEFTSNAAITVTSTDVTVNFKALPVDSGESLEITNITGTIKKCGGDLKTEDKLPVGTILVLDATGTLSAGTVTGKTVKLEGTIVVTTNDQALDTQPLRFGGGPSSGGVGGTLNLTNGPGNKHVSITGGSNKLTISSTAYETLKKTATEDTLKIGAANPPKNTIVIKYTQGGDNKCIKITNTPTEPDNTVHYGHIFTETFDMSKVRSEIISPTLMVIVGMGLVYAIYPGIAPGMIVPFYLIDKIEMVLLIATFFPPVIVALLNRGVFAGTKAYSPKTCPAQGFEGMGGWRKYTPKFCDTDGEVNNSFWHAFDILIVIKITLAAIFIYSLHYRDSNISRSIINQPKMSTALSITFYMCHEILLALGFAGVIGNNGGTYVVLPAQYVGALFMIFLAFYSEGYIIEYKSHDPAHWPTEGMWYLYGYYQLNPHSFYYDKV